MPERFAQEALGHNSKAVQRAYATFHLEIARAPNAIMDNEETRPCLHTPM